MAPAHPSLHDDPIVGLLINGKFRIQAAVTEGGMGRIYRGTQEPLGRPVAVKVLSQHLTASPLEDSFRKRFFLEASILSKLQHPNIVTVYDYGKIENLPGETYFMAMEYLAGETLSDRLKQVTRLPPQEACRIAREIARGLREAHRHGIVHRDLKPGNLMLVPEPGAAELVKILDFGLVKVIAGPDREDLTQDNSLLGSPAYMSPEQVMKGDVDARTDLYALGVIFYQLLAGRLPFGSKGSSMEILVGHVKEPVPRIGARSPGVEVPPAVEKLVFWCLEKSQAARPASAEDFLRELRAVEKSLGYRQDDDSGDHSGVRPALPELRSGGDVPTVALKTPAPSLTAPDAAPAPKPGKGMVVAGAVLGAGIAIAIGVALVAMAGKKEAPPPAPPVATGPAEAPPAPAIGTLRLDSRPTGAEVRKGDAVLGKTPLAVPLGEAVTLTVVHAGYEPLTVERGPSAADVQTVAELVPLPPPADPAPAAAKAPAKKAAKKPAKKAADDIRLER